MKGVRKFGVGLVGVLRFARASPGLFAPDKNASNRKQNHKNKITTMALTDDSATSSTNSGGLASTLTALNSASTNM